MQEYSLSSILPISRKSRKFSPSITGDSSRVVILDDTFRCYNIVNNLNQNGASVDAPTPPVGSRSSSEMELRAVNHHTYSTHSILNSIPESDPDAVPDFDTPRLIQRVDALSYMLPMIAPDGSRCMVTLTGDFAAWGACMTALVSAGFSQAEPSAWAKGGA